MIEIPIRRSFGISSCSGSSTNQVLTNSAQQPEDTVETTSTLRARANAIVITPVLTMTKFFTILRSPKAFLLSVIKTTARDRIAICRSKPRQRKAYKGINRASGIGWRPLSTMENGVGLAMCVTGAALYFLLILERLRCEKSCFATELDST